MPTPRKSSDNGTPVRSAARLDTTLSSSSRPKRASVMACEEVMASSMGGN